MQTIFSMQHNGKKRNAVKENFLLGHFPSLLPLLSEDLPAFQSAVGCVRRVSLPCW